MEGDGWMDDTQNTKHWFWMILFNFVLTLAGYKTITKCTYEDFTHYNAIILQMGAFALWSLVFNCFCLFYKVAT